MATPDPFYDDEQIYDDERIAVLQRIESEVGPEALTEEEQAILDEVFPAKAPPSNHRANLAEHVDEHWLSRLAQDCIEWYEEDLFSRKEWYNREQQGIRALGLSPRVEGGADFDGASEVVHPLLSEAIVQFEARTIAELWPPEGPCKTVLYGDASDEQIQRADRVAEFMNYQYRYRMIDAYESDEQLLFRLPLSGSMFRKMAYDPQISAVRPINVRPEYLVVPYWTESLEQTPRYHHVLRYDPATVKKCFAEGLYREIELSPTGIDEEPEDVLREEEDAVQGLTRSNLDTDQPYTFIETMCLLDIDGVHDHPDGLYVPYLVTTDYDTQKVLSIRRAWRERDHTYAKRINVIHYRFMPGLGFYGHGLYHLIGGLAQSATGTLRALLDSAQFANLQGGYRSREARIEGGDKPLRPGEWRESEASPEELRNAFFPIPYKEPSSVLFQLLGFLTERGERFASTTEAMVGEFKANMPVGTTLALIEQGSKVYSGIHKRVHRAKGREMRVLSELNGELLPDRYPYEVEGQEQMVLRADFESHVTVVPVSDPNLVSGTHRILQAQTILELSKENPDLYDRMAAHRGMLRALRIPNFDEYLLDKERRAGPVEENMAMMMMRPVRAHEEQDHLAHMMVHDHWFMTVPPEMQQQLQPMFMAHQAEHQAWAYRIEMSQMIGQPLPPVPFLEDGGGDELPIDIENEIAGRVAAAVQGMAEQQAQLPPPPDPAMAEVEAEIARKDAIAQAEQERKDAQLQAELEREAQRERHRIDREAEEHELRLKREQRMAAELLDRLRAETDMKLEQQQKLTEQKLELELMADDRRRLHEERMNDRARAIQEEGAARSEERDRTKADREAQSHQAKTAEREQAKQSAAKAKADEEGRNKMIDELRKQLAGIGSDLKALHSATEAVGKAQEQLRADFEAAESAREVRRRVVYDRIKDLGDPEVVQAVEDAEKAG